MTGYINAPLGWSLVGAGAFLLLLAAFLGWRGRPKKPPDVLEAPQNPPPRIRPPKTAVEVRGTNITVGKIRVRGKFDKAVDLGGDGNRFGKVEVDDKSH
jgi:hypothetical protein